MCVGLSVLLQRFSIFYALHVASPVKNDNFNTMKTNFIFFNELCFTVTYTHLYLSITLIINGRSHY